MRPLADILKRYDYPFPPQLIAQAPAQPRDSARLLVYSRPARRASNGGKTQFDTFKNLAQHLPPRSVLVFNQTKVIPARLWLKKPTGGKVSVLYLGQNRGRVEVLADQALAPGAVLSLSKRLHFSVLDKKQNHYLLKPSFPAKQILEVFNRYGTTPIPPYIKHSPLSEAQLKQQYQTVFAKSPGSVAAPTASLHFTKNLLAKLRRAGHTICFVTLHVNLGTFAPLTEDQIKTNQLHKEYYCIDVKTAVLLNRAKHEGRPIVAVGTTVVRTLESAAKKGKKLTKLSGSTDLFIRKNYRFKFIDALITNFHVPRSSLMMLVATLTGRPQLLKLYRTAINRKFRLFSFGDGMLIK